jgi:HPt (histidine-containing phosphotransfer) domain-containing protein
VHLPHGWADGPTDGPAAVLDDNVVRHLTGHADDHAVGMRFATRFRELLPHRLSRIARALEAGDRDLALDAVLSLKVSSATLGARQISGLAAGVERWLRLGDLDAGTRAAGDLGDAAGRLDAALRRLLAGSRVC